MRALTLPVLLVKLLGLTVVFAAFSHLAYAQDPLAPPPQAPSASGGSILDDSTKNVYGPKTCLWTTEQDLFKNRANYRHLDTTIFNYHRWTYTQHSNYLYKDLGVNGTAQECDG